jgi:hypothetical protein
VIALALVFVVVELSAAQTFMPNASETASTTDDIALRFFICFATPFLSQMWYTGPLGRDIVWIEAGRKPAYLLSLTRIAQIIRIL